MSELDQNDTVGVKVSALVREGGQEAWVTVEAVGHVRHGESADEARVRIGDFVVASMRDQIDDVVAS